MSVPVTIIAGFLGAGKTTLLNHLLQGDHGMQITVMVNDFGAIDIDSQLLQSQDATSISLKNGCICCSIQNDLVTEFLRLRNQPSGPPQYVVIETSGVSDPGKVINTLKYPQLRHAFHLDTVFTLLNAETVLSTERALKPLLMTQLDAADMVLINKVDCVDEVALADIREQWLYPAARVLETQYAHIPAGLLFAADVKSKAAVAESNSEEWVFTPVREAEDHQALFQSWSWQSSKPLGLHKLRQVMQQLPSHIYRAKGIFNTEQKPQHKVVLQMAGPRCEWSLQEGTAGVSQLVVIGARDSLVAADLQAMLDSCIA